MRFPPQDRIRAIHDTVEDPLRFYYNPFTRCFYRRRLEIAAGFLTRRFPKMLEVGYGSGIFLPELSRHCENLYAIDVHGKKDQVQAMLSSEGANAVLVQAEGERLPFEDRFFDAVVSMSTLEHTPDPAAVVREVLRVLKPRGQAVLGFPTQHPLLHLFFKLVGFDVHDHHISGPERITQGIVSQSKILGHRRFPLFGPTLYHVYHIEKP